MRNFIRNGCLVFLLLFSFSGKIKAQLDKNAQPAKRTSTEMRLMFYNVENLFDHMDDSLKSDEEYLPTGSRHWTEERFQKKINNLARVIVGVGEYSMPEIVGLCEIENRYALYRFVNSALLKNFGYRMIHYESPDPRGIDVALIYLPQKFAPSQARPISIRFPFDTLSRTRDILYVKGVALSSDTLHLFVNHWPSRFGGYTETMPKRNYVAQVLRQKVDSILSRNAEAKIVIMGDLNDAPTDESVVKYLNATTDSTHLAKNQLYNMMGGIKIDWKLGTIKSREVWETIDQFIVSQGLLHAGSGLSTTFHSAKIYNADFLLQPDDVWFGTKTFRTYNGMQYLGGFSDHLPIFMDLKLK